MIKKYFLSVSTVITCFYFGTIAIVGGKSDESLGLRQLRIILQLPPATVGFKRQATEFVKELKPQVMDEVIIDQLLSEFYNSVGYSDNPEQKSALEQIVVEESGYTTKTYNRIDNVLEHTFSRAQHLVIAKLNVEQIRNFLEAVALFRIVLTNQLEQVKTEQKTAWEQIFVDNLKLYQNIWQILFYRISLAPKYKEIKNEFQRVEKQISIQVFKASNLLSIRTGKIKHWCHGNKCSLRYVLGGFFVGPQKKRVQTFQQEAEKFRGYRKKVQNMILNSRFQNSFCIPNGTVEKLVSKLYEEYEKFIVQWQFYLDRLGNDTFVNNWGTVFQPLNNSYFTQIRNDTQQFLESFYEKTKREFKLSEIDISIAMQ